MKWILISKVQPRLQTYLLLVHFFLSLKCEYLFLDFHHCYHLQPGHEDPNPQTTVVKWAPSCLFSGPSSPEDHQRLLQMSFSQKQGLYMSEQVLCEWDQHTKGCFKCTACGRMGMRSDLGFATDGCCHMLFFQAFFGKQQQDVFLQLLQGNAIGHRIQSVLTEALTLATTLKLCGICEASFVGKLNLKQFGKCSVRQWVNISMKKQ